MFPEFPDSRREGLSWRRLAPWAVWAGLSAVYLTGTLLAFGTGGPWWWYWPEPLALGWLVFLHCRTEGDTSPVAAITFFVSGPLVGVVTLVCLAAQERFQVASHGHVTKRVSYEELAHGVAAIGCFALVAASVAAFIYARASCGLWPLRKRKSRLAKPLIFPSGSVPPPRCLAAFALDWSATGDELEAAYRALALKTHPDRGGSEEDFKQLQWHYARAKRFLRHRAKPTQKGPPAPAV